MTSSEIPPLVIPCSFLTHILARVRVADLDILGLGRAPDTRTDILTHTLYVSTT